MKDGEKWSELITKLESSKGNKILSKIKNLAISQYTFNKNYGELINFIKAYEENKSIWALKNRPKLDAVQREFLRLLHNYLSSVYSLIQHTLTFRDKLKNDKFKKFYNTEASKFKIDEIMGFVKDLRRYAQHYKVPLSKASVSFKAGGMEVGRGTFKQELLLDKKELLKWGRWTAPSKKYLDKQAKDINLRDLMAEYYNKIQTFYKEIYSKISQLYEKEIKEFVTIEREIIGLQKKMDKKRKRKL